MSTCPKSGKFRRSSKKWNWKRTSARLDNKNSDFVDLEGTFLGFPIEGVLKSLCGGILAGIVVLLALVIQRLNKRMVAMAKYQKVSAGNS